METLDVLNVLLNQFKLENDWTADLVSLINFYMYMLEDNETLTSKEKADIMQELCAHINTEQNEIENLSDCLLEYHNVCNNCYALHSPQYSKYSDLFCRKCGNSLCVPNIEELGLHENGEFLTNRIHCAYCDYKNLA